MKSCELFLDEHNGVECDDADHRAALRRMAERATESAAPWSPIVRGDDRGGLRDHLDGKPIHCGATLELQAFENRDDDLGGYTVKLPTGALVRYELGIPVADGRRAIELYASIAGYTVILPHEKGMRFRWPRRDS